MTDSRSFSFPSLFLSALVVSPVMSAALRRKAGGRRISFSARETQVGKRFGEDLERSHTHTYTHTRESVVPGRAHTTAAYLDKSCRIPHLLLFFARRRNLVRRRYPILFAQLFTREERTSKSDRIVSSHVRERLSADPRAMQSWNALFPRRTCHDKARTGKSLFRKTRGRSDGDKSRR